jgi:hypothetical protein
MLHALLIIKLTDTAVITWTKSYKFLWSMKHDQSVHMVSSLDPILSQLKPIQTCFSKMSFGVLLLFTTKSIENLVPLKFPDQYFVRIFRQY